MFLRVFPRSVRTGESHTVAEQDLRNLLDETHQNRLVCLAPESHKNVTIRFPRPLRPHFRASRTHATRLTAEEEPRKRPSWRARWRDIATASASVTLQEWDMSFRGESVGAERTYRKASSMMGNARAMFLVIRFRPTPSTICDYGSASRDQVAQRALVPYRLDAVSACLPTRSPRTSRRREPAKCRFSRVFSRSFNSARTL